MDYNLGTILIYTTTAPPSRSFKGAALIAIVITAIVEQEREKIETVLQRGAENHELIENLGLKNLCVGSSPAEVEEVSQSHRFYICQNLSTKFFKFLWCRHIRSFK